MDGDEDAIDYNDDDPEDEEVYEEIQLFHMMKKTRWWKERSRSYDAEINEIAQMIWVRVEQAKRTTKKRGFWRRGRRISIRRGWDKKS